MTETLKTEPTRTIISVFHYDESTEVEKNDITLVDAIALLEENVLVKEQPPVTWININGIEDKGLIDKLGERFNLHPIVMEHILNTSTKPKIEDYGQYTFIILKMLQYNEKNEELSHQQVSLILGNNYVISIKERGHEGDGFDSVRKRIRAAGSRLRKSGADYLAYRLIDAIVDHYFAIVEVIGEQIERSEEEAITMPDRATLRFMQQVRKDMLYLRKTVWPVREILNSMQRGESQLIKADTRNYLRDLYDHTVQVIDNIETFRDMMSSLLEIYLSSVSNRLNEVMKVLTMISTIFMPLTFIVGVYGMNFHFMPELSMRYAYFALWGVMIFIVGLMFMMFRKLKWF